MSQSPEQQRAAFDAAIRNAPARQVNVGSSNPLDRVAADAARALNVNVQSVPEQSRAQQIPSDIRSGRSAPDFYSRPTPAPFPSRTDVPVPAPRRAGGSKS